jgi:ribosomal protein S28E/S33
MKRFTALALVALALHVTAPALAAGPAGEITHVSGAVMAQKPDGQSRILSVKSPVNEGDVVATADNSYARVKFSDGSEAVLRPASQVKIDRFNFEEQKPQADGMVLSLLKGGFRSVTGLLGRRNPANVRVATPSATIGIRGTTFGALFCNNDCGGAGGGGTPPANGLHVDVSDGMIILQNEGGSQNFSAGQFGYVPNMKAPPVIVPPNPAVQFTPPASFLAPSGQAGGIGKSGGAACTI